MTHRGPVVLALLLMAVCSSIALAQSELAEVGRLELGTTYCVLVRAGLAVASTNDGVVLIDVDDPDAPAVIARFELGNGVFGMCLMDDCLYLAAIQSGLVLVDIADPKRPVELGRYTAPMPVTDVWSNGTVAVAQTMGGEDLRSQRLRSGGPRPSRHVRLRSDGARRDRNRHRRLRLHRHWNRDPRPLRSRRAEKPRELRGTHRGAGPHR